MKTLINILFFCNLLSNIAFGQSRCDQLPDTAAIFVIAEEMPEANLTDDELADLLNTSIDLVNYRLESIEAVYYGVTVNCKGQAFDYEIMRPIEPDLDSKVLQTLKSNLTWTPGIFRGNPVDVRLTKRIYIVESQFQMLTDKELKKLRKKNK
jgi:hypothetical protein